MAGASLVLVALLLQTAGSSTVLQAAGVSRHHEGDTFLLRRDGVAVACSSTLCADSHATPALTTGVEPPQCACRCPPELPVFREDLHVCVDDVHECSLATFKNGAKIQKVPFVFLPMKGQIIHPSADIVFKGAAGEEPICVVSSAQFLTRNGWLELRNTSDTEPPLRLFRDQRHTFLQWLGEQDLRLGMEGRVLLARLMCKDPSGHVTGPPHSGTVSHSFSTPCVAFRVAGSQGAREVMFSSDYSVAGSGGLLHGLLGGGAGGSEHRSPGGLSTSEGVAVGLCVLLLGLVYAASVCVYVHVRRTRRRRKKRGQRDDDSERGHSGGGDLDLLAEGVVKNNPLLQGGTSYVTRGGTSFPHSGRRSLRGGPADFMGGDVGPKLGGSSEEDDEDVADSSEHSTRSEERANSPHKVTSTKALVHPECPPPPSVTSGLYTLTLQPAAEGGSMERHPEESVSIVETLDEATTGPFARACRDFSFLGRHSMGSSGLGLPGGEGPSSSRCHSGPSPFLAGPGSATRRKLYFNPAYFEPEMLHAPPPAALEFLHKLREVITLSKHKMAAKRFAPTLLGIPEERDSVSSRTSQSVQGYTNRNSWTGSQRRGSEPAASKPCSLLPDDVTGSKQQTIRRWLEDLESGDPVEDQMGESKPAEVKHDDGVPVVTPPPKKLMDAVIKELVRERGLTAPEGSTSTSEDTTKSADNKTSESKLIEDNDYEVIALQPTVSSPPTAPDSPRPPLMMYCLPELLAKTNGYSLVSEVYVNDGYGSNQSSASRASSSRNHRRPPKGSVGSSSEPSSHTSSESQASVQGDEQNYPGSLTIKLSESPAHQYRERRGDESEEFEPDTLDRAKRGQREDICADSLERPMKILLKSSGSFYKDAVMNENLNESWNPPKDIWQYSDNKREKKKRSPSSIADLRSTNISFASTLNRNSEFGSLREIFEAKRQQQLQKQIENMFSSPQMQQKHAARQRGTTRSLIDTNQTRWRHGITPQMIDEIRDLMWRSTPEAVLPIPRLSSAKPKRQRSDISSSPPTPPPPVPPSSNPPSLPPKHSKNGTHFHHPPLPPRDVKPPPSLPPKNLRGSRSPIVVASRDVAGASAGSDIDDDEGGSCTLGRQVEDRLHEAFSSWGKQRSAPHRPGDSGYLSSDSSSNSLKRKVESSDTDESLCDGGSESGAESIGTDSFFFGRVRPQEALLATPVLAGKKKPPPPPKRVNSKLESRVLPPRNESIINNLHSKYAL